MVSEKLSMLFGREVAEGFETLCGALLAEADSRAHNPIDGSGVHIRPDDRLRLAAAGLLMACEFLHKVEDGIFAITDLGSSDYKRLEKTWYTRPPGPMRGK